MDLGGGTGLSTADQSMAASGTTGSISSGFSGPSGGGGDNNDPYQGFVQASQPRGLTAIQRAVQNTVQRTKDFLSQPANRRGIIGSLIGGALLGPFGALLGGSLGQRYGGNVSSFFDGPKTDTSDTEIEMLTRAGLLPNQFTMPMNKPNIPILTDGGITNIRTFPEISNLMANKPDYKVGDISDKTFDAAIGSGFNPYTGEELKPGEAEELKDQRNNQSGINQLQFIV